MLVLCGAVSVVYRKGRGKKRDLEMDSEVCSSQLDLELENGSAKGTASLNFVSTQN